MSILYKNIDHYFTNQLELLHCNDDTRAYIVSIFNKFKRPDFDYSKNSITILYTEAKFRQDFLIFQNIGDWLFFCNTLFPEHLNAASNDYYYTIGQLSYYSCYMLINKQWKLFEEMADKFIHLSNSTRNIIHKS